MKPFRSAFGAAAVLLLVPSPAALAQEDAGAPAFATRVQAACTAAAAAKLDGARATVDPVGSRRYGMAVVSGIETGTRDTRSVLCVFDRQSGEAEVGSPLDLAEATSALAAFPVGSEDAPAATLIYPGSATCGQACLASWTALSPDDQSQLTALPEQVRQTLASAPPASEPAPIGDARAAAAAIVAAAGGAPDAGTARDLSGIAAGTRECTHYWFGYRGEPARVEDRFQCRVDRLANGGLNVTRTSGNENLVYQVQMLGPGLALIGGRNAPAGPPPGGYDLSRPLDPANPNFGNEVGLGVARTDGRFFAASINQRGIEPKGPDFFQMVVVEPPNGR